MSGPGSSSKKLEAAKSLLKSAWKSSEAFVRNRTKTEILALEATNDAAWGPTGAQMQVIAEASFDAEKFRQVWGIILQRFESEAQHWRRIYKALLLTEHLLKNSSQHVVQTILDGSGAIEGLKQFKYLDEKNKDHGINVSNRAKELTLLLADPDRIRAERVKAKALKDKFKGVSREDMVAASGASFGGSTGATNSAWAQGAMQRSASTGSFGSARGGFEDARDGAAPHYSQLGLSGGNNGASVGSPRPAVQRALPADNGADQGDEGLEGDELALGRSSPMLDSKSPAKGYTAMPADPVTATQQRIDKLRRSGMLHDDSPPSPPPPASASAGRFPAGPSPSTAMTNSSSYEELSAARPRGTQAKPSLSELMARKAGPKKLQDVHINPAIKAAIGGIKMPAPAAGAASASATASPTKPPTAAAALPPAPPAAPAPASHHGYSPALAASPPSSLISPASPAALADLLDEPVQAGPYSPAASHSPTNALAESAGSPVALAGAAAPKQVAAAPLLDAFDTFQQSTSMPATDDSFGAFTKPGASPASATINITAAAGIANGSPHALPAHLFAEPVMPPAYGSAASWGTNPVGPGLKQPLTGKQATSHSSGVIKAAAAADAFSEFDPFKGQ